MQESKGSHLEMALCLQPGCRKNSSRQGSKKLCEGGLATTVRAARRFIDGTPLHPAPSTERPWWGRKPHQCDIKATSKRVDSQPIGTPKPPQCDPNATPRLPQSSHKAWRERAAPKEVRAHRMPRILCKALLQPPLLSHGLSRQRVEVADRLTGAQGAVVDAHVL
jgi:hypothetical protein